MDQWNAAQTQNNEFVDVPSYYADQIPPFITLVA